MYGEAVELLTSSSRFHIKLGLEQIAAAMNLLGNPQDELKCIHVAGTNGKGSVCAILASILQAAGLKVGLYTSPHIYEYTERIKINGREIPQEDFARLVFAVCNNEIPLTEFEILTAVMFKYFADQKVDVVVLETGLGGRYDATNVIKSNLCAVITHIDYDHTERLGFTLEEITAEKEGIIKQGCPVVRTSMTPPPSPLPQGEGGLRGLFQRENTALALEVIKLLYPDLSQEVIDEGLQNVRHPARFQVVNENLIVDAAHNPNGVAALRESLDFYYPDRPRRFVFGCLSNKDHEKMTQILFRPEDDVYFVDFKNSHKFQGKKFTSLGDLPQDDRLTVICGSIYMISEIIPRKLLLSY